jgi:hypothetical protein
MNNARHNALSDLETPIGDVCDLACTLGIVYTDFCESKDPEPRLPLNTFCLTDQQLNALSFCVHKLVAMTQELSEKYHQALKGHENAESA